MEVEKRKTYVASKIDPDPVSRDTVDEEKQNLRQEITRLEQTVQDAEFKCQKYLEDKKKLKNNINHLKKQLVEVKTKLNIANVRFEESAKKLSEATVEWKAFQQDLLTTVKVANDLKIEAQENVERLTVKNKKLNERIPLLEAEINRLQEQLSSVATFQPDSKGNVIGDTPDSAGTIAVQKVKIDVVTKVTESSDTCGRVVEGTDSDVKKAATSRDVDGSLTDKDIKLEGDSQASDAKLMLPPKVVPRRSVSVQPFCVSVAPRSPLRSISVDPVPSNMTNTSNNQSPQGQRSRDPLSYPSSRKSIAKYVDFRTASQMSVKNLIMSLENASKNPSTSPTIVTSPVPSPAVVVLRQQSLNASSLPPHVPLASRFSNPEPSTLECKIDNACRPMEITTITIRESRHQSSPSSEGDANTKNAMRQSALTMSSDIIPAHEEYTQVQNKNNEENSRQQNQTKSSSVSPKKTSSPTSPLSKPLVLFKMENLRSNLR